MSDIIPNVIVSMPSQLFTLRRKFAAVSNGKVYIGKIDMDPTIPDNQIQVYIENEDGSHVPVAQPIIINQAGFPVYNGQISKFVTVEGYSMVVYDSYGAQQFYFPNILKYDPDQFRKLIEADDGFTLIGGLSENYIRIFDNVEIMIAEPSLKEGETVKTRGYYKPDDEGSGTYLITKNKPDGLVNVSLKNGLTATLDTKFGVDILSVGAKPAEDIGDILVGLQEIEKLTTILIPKKSFDCNKQINVRKNFLFSAGSQIINRELLDDMFVFETDNLFFKSEKIGGARIAVDTNLKNWNYNVALVIGKNNLRNLSIDSIKFISNYSDRSGTSLRIRCNNVLDGTNNPIKRWNSITACNFNNLFLEEGENALVIEAYQPTDDFDYKESTNWITSCHFKNLHTKGINGIILKCIPKEESKYAYYTQIADLDIEFIQQWTKESKFAIKIDGAGANKINSYIWDYAYYGEQGKYMIDVRGADGRDNIIVSNLPAKFVNFNVLSNIYIPRIAEEQNAIGLRRIGNIRKVAGSFILSDAYKNRGFNKVYVDSVDKYLLLIEYNSSIDNWRPFIKTQSLNAVSGFRWSLIPNYNQSGVASGIARFYVVRNSDSQLEYISDLPDGIEFNIEIICTQ
ncbi:phage head-binding domain-containing protein [Arsenophonus nasoniae]|uniref:phage head-binding domain-containing protein n=1 Tax=Arsenophonus nasoniae TaxID=638 RepID=UPI003879FAFD